MEKPSLFCARNYRGIEYFRTRNASLYLQSCGIERCVPGYTWPGSAREGYHLHIVLSGKGELRVMGRQYAIHEGQMFLVKDGEPTEYSADTEDPWYYAWIVFCGHNARSYMEYAGFGDGIYVQDCHVDPTAFRDILQKIIDHPHLSYSSEIYRLSLAIQALSLAIESYEKSQEARPERNMLTVDDYVNYAVEYIQNNYAHVRIGDVAEYLGLNRTYMTSIFKRKMLLSPQEFLMQVRMDHARDMLQQTDFSIRAISGEVGYEDQLTFSKIFKKKFGVSPEKYRRALRENGL